MRNARINMRKTMQTFKNHFMKQAKKKYSQICKKIFTSSFTGAYGSGREEKEYKGGEEFPIAPPPIRIMSWRRTGRAGRKTLLQ